MDGHRPHTHEVESTSTTKREKRKFELEQSNQLDTVEMMSQSMVTNQRDISIEALSSQGLLQLQLMEHE